MSTWKAPTASPAKPITVQRFLRASLTCEQGSAKAKVGSWEAAGTAIIKS